MPITITPSTTTPFLGWFVTVKLQSDFVGPLPSGSTWSLAIYTDADQTQLLGSIGRVSQLNPVQMTIGDDSDNAGFGPFAAKDGDTVTAHAELQSNTGAVLDSSTVQFPWHASSKDYRGLVAEIRSGAGAVSLSSDQAAQLQTITDAVQPTITDQTGTRTVTLADLFSRQTIDQLTLFEATAGPTGDFVGINFDVPAFGLIIRIASVPPDVSPITPDGDYYPADLAVVRFFRGEDLWLRKPIHTTSAIVQFEGESLTTFLAGLLFTEWPPDMTAQITWRRGVTGQVFMMRFP